MDTIEYRTRGVCARMMEIDVEDGILLSFRPKGGCDGNLKGISRLVEGMAIDEVIRRLEGLTCGYKATSCPDQLAQALKAYKAKQEQG